jgi:hypothetical protein
MSINTNGLTALSTNNTTWASPLVNEMPVAVASQIRGGLWLVPGTVDNRLTDIPGIMLQDGMIVYLQTGYTEPGDASVTRTGATYYRYTNTTARPANGVLNNTIPMWSVFQTGGSGGDGPAVAVDDIDALDTFAAADPGPTQGQLVLVRDPRGADDADPTINDLPGGIDWDAAATENLNLIVSWDEVDDDWDFVRIAPDNPDNVFVELAGDTMTGTLTIDNTTNDENALVTGAGHDVVLGTGANVVFDGANGDGTLTTAALTEDRTYTLPDATGTIALTAAGGVPWVLNPDADPDTITAQGTDATVVIPSGNITTTGNDNIDLDPAGTGTVIFGADATAEANLTVNGNTTLGNADTDTVTVAGPLTCNENVTLNNATDETTTINGILNFDIGLLTEV